MRLRYWWWYGKEAEDMPRSVREYTIRRNLYHVIPATIKSDEDKRSVSATLVAAALQWNCPQQISEKLRDEMIAASFRLLNGVPNLNELEKPMRFKVLTHTTAAGLALELEQNANGYKVVATTVAADKDGNVHQYVVIVEKIQTAS